MPRAEVGSQKWLANKMKAKGLQKLKWYCQMCEKQCRDENGFKCHRLSEGHQRMMQVFCQNSGRFMDGFSRTFESEFMKLMRTRYCKTKILANSVYQELISDKQHVHMNATIWVTLSEFVLYLGRSGKCKVEHTPKGWYIEYIDQEKLKREEDERAKIKREITLEQRHQRLIEKLIEEAKERGDYDKEEEFTPLLKDPDEKIVITTNTTTTSTSNVSGSKGVNVFKEFYQKSKQSSSNSDKTNDKERSREGERNRSRDKEHRSDRYLERDRDRNTSSTDRNSVKRKSALEEIMESNLKRSQRYNNNQDNNYYKRDNDEREFSRKNEKELKGHKEVDQKEQREYREEKEQKTWLSNNIMVKVILKSHDMYKQKFKVIKVTDNMATLETSNGSFQIQDRFLETVVPSVNSKVKVLTGRNKGLTGTLVSADPSNLKATVSLEGNLVHLTYDDLSQYVP